MDLFYYRDNSALDVTATSDGHQLWGIYADPWNVANTASGSSSVAYTGSGAINMSVNYTSLTDEGVNGYPFIG